MVTTGPKLPGKTAWKAAPNTPVAFVNGEPITVAQWLQRMTLVYGTPTLDQLLQETLIRQEARKQGVTVSPAEVEKRVTEEIQRFRSSLGTPERFQDFLKGRKLTEAGLRDMGRASVEMRLMQEKLRDKVAASATVTDKEIQDAYEAQKFAFQVPEEAHISQILISVSGTDPKADADAKAKAEEILKRAKGMTLPQFAELAKQTSQDENTKAKGGDLPGLHKPSFFGPTFDTAVFGGSPGLLPEPVRSFQGYHVIYLQERTPARTKPLSEVKPELKQQLLTRKQNEAFTTYMQNVQKNAKEEIRLQF